MIINVDKTTKQEITSLRADNKSLREDLYDFKLEINGRLNGLETRMEQGFKDQLKWMIGLMFGFSSLIITLIKLL